jgi:hypothetical protein
MRWLVSPSSLEGTSGLLQHCTRRKRCVSRAQMERKSQDTERTGVNDIVILHLHLQRDARLEGCEKNRER